MTTDSEVAPNPGEQPPDPNANAGAAQAEPEQHTEPDVVDVDDQDFAAAQAEVEAEKASGTGDGEEPAGGTGTEQQPQAPAPQPKPQQRQQPQNDTIMVPKPRLDEALGKTERALQEAAYWKGVADAKVPPHAQPQGQQGQQQPAPQQPTADQRLAALHTEQDVLSKKFDDGDINYSELKKQERELNNREQAIREEVLLAKVPKQQPQANQNNDELYLDDATANLEQQHPWVVIADKVGTEVDWNYVKDRAADELIKAGVDPTQGNRGKLALRTKVAELMDQLGPNLFGARAKANGIPIPGEAAGDAPPKPKPMSPAAQARSRKLDLAATAPPNLSQMSGTTGDSEGEVSDSRIEAMSEDEIGALPDSKRRKLLGLTGL